MSTDTVPPLTITYDDFVKVDIRAGRINSAEAVPKSQLLKLMVNFGEADDRQVLARISKSYAPEELVGLTAAFVVNLPPREMKGLVSDGMILAAEIEDTGNPTDHRVAVVFLPGTVKPGTRLG